jgi:hypothetical protein
VTVAEQEHRAHGHAMYRHLGDTAPDRHRGQVGGDAGVAEEFLRAALGVVADAEMSDPTERKMPWPT